MRPYDERLYDQGRKLTPPVPQSRPRPVVLFISTAVIGIGVLVGCGSNNGDLHNVHGVAATGAAMGGASIAVKCADGLVASTTTNTDGSFSTLARGDFPCLIEVNDGKRKLHSVATSSARVMVTPLTEQLVGALSHEIVDTADFFAKFDASFAPMVSSDLALKKRTP